MAHYNCCGGFGRVASRRAFLRSAGFGTTSLIALHGAGAFGQAGAKEGSSFSGNPGQEKETYETHAKGIRILPGQWRPHYPWEQIAWVSPPWPSQDYIWLDFPEAIFTSQGLIYLSHINPPIPTVFAELPKVRWREVSDGLAFERELPNRVSFGGVVRKDSDRTVGLELHIRNGSAEVLGNITLQTCAYLRGIKEFADFTTDNKFVHAPESGWISLPEALAVERLSGRYGIGWRNTSHLAADWPVLVTVSNQARRLAAMTWFESTLSLVSNPRHPCMHADPRFPDLSPGEAATIRGKLVFFEGDLADFDFQAISTS